MADDWNLYGAFARHFPPGGERTLLRETGGRQWSYGEVEQASARVAGWLAARGLGPGDIVTVQAPKCPAWLFLYLACLRSGLVFHPLNDGYRPAELAYFLADARPRLVVCDPGQTHIFQELLKDTSTPIETLDEAGGGSFAAAAKAARPAGPPVHRDRADPAVLLYSSGTTGRPKGALISHGNLVANARTLTTAWGFSADDWLLHALPVYHAHGLFVAFGCVLMSGAGMIFLPRFDAAEVLGWLPEATVFMGVPTHYTRLLGQAGLDADRCRNVRLFVSGSAPLPPEVFRAFEGRTGQRILERYGMTETGMLSSNPLEGERRAGTVGPPLPGVSIRVTGDDGTELLPDVVGNIEVKGPNVFREYLGRPEQTAAAFTPDGWFRTGDKGAFSADGYLRIAGRSADMIISGGLNVYPREVEIVLDALPGVAESAVIGVPHPDFGEGVVAVVVLTPGSRPDPGALIAGARDQLAAFKVPKQVFFRDELPRNAMGKVRKDELRRAHAGTFAGSPTATGTDP